MLAAAVLSTAAATAQHGYGYMRPLDDAKSGWGQLKVPGDMFEHLNDELTDIRILQPREKDTVEVPYALQVIPYDTLWHTRHEGGKGIYTVHASAIYHVSMKVKENRQEKLTEITVDLPQHAPVHTVRIHVADKLNYRRHFFLMTRVHSDRSKPVKEPYIYDYVTENDLRSGKNNSFSIDTQFAEQFRILIHNDDNAPLTIDSISVEGPAYQLMARFPADGNYLLVYGNPNALAPSYDIVNFPIPGHGIPVDVGGELKLPLKPSPQAPKATATTEKEPGISHQTWLYILMGVLIVLIGAFTLSMMRSKDKEEPRSE